MYKHCLDVLFYCAVLCVDVLFYCAVLLCAMCCVLCGVTQLHMAISGDQVLGRMVITSPMSVIRAAFSAIIFSPPLTIS